MLFSQHAMSRLASPDVFILFRILLFVSLTCLSNSSTEITASLIRGIKMGCSPSFPDIFIPSAMSRTNSGSGLPASFDRRSSNVRLMLRRKGPARGALWAFPVCFASLSILFAFSALNLTDSPGHSAAHFIRFFLAWGSAASSAFSNGLSCRALVMCSSGPGVPGISWGHTDPVGCHPVAILSSIVILSLFLDGAISAGPVPFAPLLFVRLRGAASCLPPRVCGGLGGPRSAGADAPAPAMFCVK